MKTIAVLLISCLNFFAGYGQEVVNTSFKSLKGRLPFPVKRYVKLITNEDRCKNESCVNMCGFPRLRIFSDSAMNAYSIASGIVTSVFDVDSVWAVFVRNGHHFMAYSNLNTVFVNRDDTLRAGQLIGQVKAKGYDNLYELEFVLMYDKRFIDPYPWFSIYKKSSSKD